MPVGRILAIVALAGLLSGCAASRDVPPSMDEQTDEASGTASTTKTVHVRISLDTGDQSLGAYSLLLRYDRDRARFLEVTGARENGFQAPFHEELEGSRSSIGTLRIAAFDVDRTPSGTTTVTVVSFSSDHRPSEFIRELRVETASDPDGNRIDASASMQFTSP